MVQARMPYCNVSAMQNNEGLQTTHNSALINQLSIFICQSIIPILQQHPELIVANYQHINWNEDKYQSALLASLNKKIASLADTSLILANVKQYLGIFLVQSFFDSPDFYNIETRILSLLHHSTLPELNNQANANNLQESKNSKNTFISSAIAILLLDAENLQLNTETEKFLTTICTYPIQIKIAFANWCSMGKLDIELHGRGYDLIHVPSGRDNADGKMITFGSSIHERYPNAKEVLVCSSDKVMTNLCNHLQQNGLTVYRVSKQGINLVIFNSYTGKNITQSIQSLPEISSIEEFILKLKSLIKTEQKHNNTYWIKLYTISQSFKNRYQCTISQVASKLLPGKKARDIFLSYPTEFVVHQVDEVSELYIALFEINPSLLVDANVEALPISVQEPLLSIINSKADLEEVLKNLIKTLTIKSPISYVNVGLLSGKFNQQYGTPITQQLKCLQISGNFLKFLQSCSSFELKQTTKGWEVAVR
ncbi:hypothetical protein Cal7507_1211 [Calothrix sp. PCC 7507]|nr:hypothetical protein Cal7507_1211 [Calothrix sp. PCC 7507]